MGNLIVVDDPKAWPFDICGTEVVSPRTYVTDPAYRHNGELRVFNLCKSYRYQSLGYYASLLADARGHKPLPNAGTMKDFRSRNLVRYLIEDLSEAIQVHLADLHTKTFDLYVYFGQTVDEQYAALGRELFDTLRVPLLHAHFECRSGRSGDFHLRRVRPVGGADIPQQHRRFVAQAAARYFEQRRYARPRADVRRYRLAILHEPGSRQHASNAEALRKFEKAASDAGMRAELVTAADFGRLPEFDALFIRATTSVDHYTYRFSRRAAAEGLVVIDDPVSILRCNNKVYLAELLLRHGVAVPKTLLLHKNNIDRAVPELGLPCVLKEPDSSFSQGVDKVDTEAALRERATALLGKSELIVAQEFRPTAFDWRIGVLDRQPLFAAKYFMVPGHWQIFKHGSGPGDIVEGCTEAVALDDTPQEVVALALQAANLIGNGLYGVDIKQTGSRFVVIEINDNPSVDTGNEDAILGDAIYRSIIANFIQRLDARRLSELP